ncbi:MAG: DUF2167 domain-containing protein [Alphaproteobacteria bacterium]|nr:DUF2167 domain-containing protein [Alphaproteobacteria bacterium]
MGLLRSRSADALRAALASALVFAAVPAFADGPPETPPRSAAAPAQPPPQEPVRAQPLQPTTPAAETTAASGPQTGTIPLANGAAAITVPAGYEFWPASEAQSFLQRANAAPPSGQVLGLIATAGAQPTAPDFWGTVVSYHPIGYVGADSASTLQGETLEADVRQARADANRPFEGFILQPAFDPAGALSWAERTAAQPAPTVRDLRHEQRILGRAGVVTLTTIARTDQQGQAVNAAAAMRQATAFATGQRYADFNAETDNRSNYDVKGLVTGVPNATVATAASADAGGVAGKGKEAGGGLQSWFPWIALGVVGLAGIGWFVLGRRNRDLDDDDDDDDAVEATSTDGDPKPSTT